MDGRWSPSPPLPPDPPLPAASTPAPQVQPFQEPFVASSLRQPEVAAKQPNMARASAQSGSKPIAHRPQPIRSAVEEAFDQSPTANRLDAAFIAQVTEAVVKNLQAANLSPATPTPTGSAVPQHQAQYPPPIPPSSQAVPPSPVQSTTASMPPSYTPPSPGSDTRARQDSTGSYESASSPPSESGSAYSRHSGRSARTGRSTRDEETPRATPAESVEGNRVDRGNATAPRRRGSGDAAKSRTRKGSGSDESNLIRGFRRDSTDSQASMAQYDGAASRTRARPARIPSDVEEVTTLEKIWQPLFDSGNPTLRLGQFLRGLAIHLIDHYEPKCSLVVTPAKMMRFFDETKVSNELYPWQTIFGGKMSMPSLSIMYRRLVCQHHLVQVQNHEVPTVPGLTPDGFEWFMTCMIQAHPDTEFERLAKAVMNMPISNADNKSERFPKELSRKLLPALPNSHSEQRLIASLAHEPDLIRLRNSHAMPPPPRSAPPQQSSFNERERKPYAQTSFSNAVDDDDLSMPSVPIERERQPYVAKEGTGKLYESDDSRDEPARPPASQIKPDGEMNIPRPLRANTAHSMSYGRSGSTPSDARPIPQPNRHRMSTGTGVPPSMPNGEGYARSSGRRSPPPINPFARSEPIGTAEIPASQYASNLHSAHPSGIRDHFSGDPDEDTLRRYQGRSRTATGSGGNGSSSFDDDASPRGRPIPRPKLPPPGSCDSIYGSAGGPGPPVGSYPSRPRVRTADHEDRKRSMYVRSGPGSGAGTDGYGSFAGNGGQQQPYASSSVQY